MSVSDLDRRNFLRLSLSVLSPVKNMGVLDFSSGNVIKKIAQATIKPLASHEVQYIMGKVALMNDYASDIDQEFPPLLEDQNDPPLTENEVDKKLRQIGSFWKLLNAAPERKELFDFLRQAINGFREKERKYVDSVFQRHNIPRKYYDSLDDCQITRLFNGLDGLKNEPLLEQEVAQFDKFCDKDWDIITTTLEKLGFHDGQAEELARFASQGVDVDSFDYNPVLGDQLEAVMRNVKDRLSFNNGKPAPEKPQSPKKSIHSKYEPDPDKHEHLLLKQEGGFAWEERPVKTHSKKINMGRENKYNYDREI